MDISSTASPTYNIEDVESAEGIFWAGESSAAHDAVFFFQLSVNLNLVAWYSYKKQQIRFSSEDSISLARTKTHLVPLESWKAWAYDFQGRDSGNLCALVGQ